MSEESMGGEVSSSQSESSESNNQTPLSSSLEAPSSKQSVSKAIAQKAAQAPAVAPAQNIAQPNVPQAPAPYVPNLKYKVFNPALNGQQEKEFAEWAKALVKDAQTEKELRQLYEKGDGIESIKTERAQLKQNFQALSQNHAALQKDVNTAMDHLKKGDFQSFFEGLRVPEQAIFKWVHDRIQFMQKPQHEQAAFNQLREQEQQMRQLQEQNQHMQSVTEQYAVHMKNNEMESYLNRPDLAGFAQQYDQRVGANGAFRRAVIERGQYHAYTRGVDITPTQAINEVLQLLGAVSPQGHAPQQSQAPEMQGQGNQPSQTPQQNAKPVITNVQGRNSSPVKKAPRNLEELKRIAKDFAA